MKIDQQDPLRCIPFRGDYGWRRMLDKSQWRQRYRVIVMMYKWQSYRLHNPFVVQAYIDDKGEQQ
jgi:hypothetical protein